MTPSPPPLSKRGKKRGKRKKNEGRKAADTTGRVYDDFSRLLFLHAHREASALANEIPEESGQFRFLRAARYANIKGSVGLILAKASAMRISIPLDLSSRPFIPLPRFICRRRPLPLLAPSLVFTPRRSVLVVHEGFSCLLVVPVFLTPYSFSVTFFSLWSSPFFILLQINERKGDIQSHRPDKSD